MQKIFGLVAAALLCAQVHAQTVDRTHAPKAGPAPVIKIKDPVVYKLPNGIVVLVVEDHKVAKINAGYSIDMGPVTEGSKAGVMELMGGMLNEGTTQRSKAQFDEAVDRIGANVSLSSGGGGVSALTRYFDSAFLLMAEGLQHPAFTQASFDKLKQQKISAMQLSEKNAKAIAARVTSALLYGTSNPKGEFETAETVNALTLNDVDAAYKKYITPARGYLTFVGDIKPEDAKAIAEKAFGSWKGNNLQLEKITPAVNVAKTEIDLIDVPSAVQSEIKVVNLVTLPLSSPDYFAALLANEILGGGATGYLFLNLREKHGFTYGAYSSVGSGRFQTSFTAAASVRNAKTDSAVTEFLHDINRIRTEKITQQALKQVKAVYNGSFALGLEDPSRISDFASNIILNNLPKDFYRTYLQKLNAVTVADVQRVALKYFNYTNTRIVVTGKAADIEAGLRKLPYPVKLYDAYAKPVTAAPAGKHPASANTDGKTVITNYLQAIGGVDAAKSVKTLSSTGSISMQGAQLVYMQKKMAPNKLIQTLTMGGQAVMKKLFDGTTGYQVQGPGKQELPAEDLIDLKAETSLFDQVDYLSNPAIKLDWQGIVKVGTEDANKVLVTLVSGKTTTEFYSLKTNLLLKIDQTETANGQTMNNSIEFADYKKVGGVLLPFKETITITAGEQTQSFDIVCSDIKVNDGVTEADFK